MNLGKIKKIVQDKPYWAYSYNRDTGKYYCKSKSAVGDATIQDLKKEGIRLVDRKFNLVYWLFVSFNVLLILILYGLGAYK